jgi:hypothetical protein
VNPGATNNVSSYDLLALGYPAGVFTSPAPWELRVFQNDSEGTGYLESFQLSITVITSPLEADSDHDGLLDGGPRRVSVSDTANMTYLDGLGIFRTDNGDQTFTYWGEASFGTDPWSSDTDGDALEDKVEIFGLRRIKSDPLKADTDGDTIPDAPDIDPLNNLVVKVTLDRIHHSVPCIVAPTLQGVIQVGGRNFYSGRRLATEDTEDRGPICRIVDTTAVFNVVYHADVPDDSEEAVIHLEAWSINPFPRNDDHLLSGDISHRLTQAGATFFFVSAGGHWLSGKVETFVPRRVNVVAVYDPNATVTVDGIVRFPVNNRYFVLQLNVEAAAPPFVQDFNVVVAPWELYLSSFLYGRLQNSSREPFRDDTAFYGEDPDRPQVSYFVPGMIAGNLSGAEALQVLDWLTQNFTSATVYRFATPGTHVLLVGLPDDIVRLVPYEGYEDSGQDPAPKGSIWEKATQFFTDVANAIVGGLLAIGSFLLGLIQAAVEWGLKILAAFAEAVLGAVQAAVEAVRKALSAVFEMVIATLRDAIRSVVEPVLQGARSALSALVSAFLSQEASSQPQGTASNEAKVRASDVSPSVGETFLKETLPAFLLLTTSLFIVLLIAGGLMDSLPMVGAAFLVFFVAAFTVLFLGAIATQDLEAGQGTDPSNFRQTLSDVDTSLGNLSLTLDAIDLGIGAFLTPFIVQQTLDITPRAVLIGFLLALIALAASFTTVTAADTQVGCFAGVLTLFLAATALVSLTIAVAKVAFAGLTLGMRIVLGIMGLVFLALTGVSFAATAGYLSNHCIPA